MACAENAAGSTQVGIRLGRVQGTFSLCGPGNALKCSSAPTITTCCMPELGTCLPARSSSCRQDSKTLLCRVHEKAERAAAQDQQRYRRICFCDVTLRQVMA